jgi:hypothetical protein
MLLIACSPDILEFGRDPSKYYDSPERYNDKNVQTSGVQKTLLEAEKSMVSNNDNDKPNYQDELNNDSKKDTEKYDETYSHIPLVPRTITDLTDNFLSEKERKWEGRENQAQESNAKEEHAYHFSSVLFKETKSEITPNPENKALETYSNTFETLYLKELFPTGIPEKEKEENNLRKSFRSVKEPEISVDLPNESMNGYPVFSPKDSEEVEDSDQKEEFQETSEEGNPNADEDFPDKIITHPTHVVSSTSSIIFSPSTYLFNSVPTYTLALGKNQEEDKKAEFEDVLEEEPKEEKEGKENDEDEKKKEKEENKEEKKEKEFEEEEFEEEEISNTTPEAKLSWKDKLLKKLKSTFGGSKKEKRALLATNDLLYFAEDKNIGKFFLFFEKLFFY